MKTALLVAALGLFCCSVVQSSGGYGGESGGYGGSGGGYGEGGGGGGGGGGGERPRVNLGISLKVPAMKINLGRMNMPKISIRAKIKQSHGPKVINVPEMHIDTNSKLPAPEGARAAGHGSSGDYGSGGSSNYGGSSMSYGGGSSGGSEYSSGGGSSYGGGESSPSYGGQSSEQSSYGGSAPSSGGYGQQQQQQQYQEPKSSGYGQQEQSMGYGQQQQQQQYSSGGYGQEQQSAGGYGQQSAGYGGEQAPSQAYAQHQSSPAGYGAMKSASQPRANRMSYMPKFSIYSPSSQYQQSQSPSSYEQSGSAMPSSYGSGGSQESDAMREQINAAIAAYEKGNQANSEGGYGSQASAPSSPVNYPPPRYQMSPASYGAPASQPQQYQSASSYSMGSSYPKQAEMSQASPSYGEMNSGYSGSGNRSPSYNNYQQQQQQSSSSSSSGYGNSYSSHGGNSGGGGFSISVGDNQQKYGGSGSAGFQPLEPGTTMITSSNDNYSGDNRITISSNPEKQHQSGYGGMQSYEQSVNSNEQSYAPASSSAYKGGASGDLYQKATAPAAAQHPVYDDSAVNYAAMSQGNYGARTNRAAIGNKHHYGGHRH